MSWYQFLMYLIGFSTAGYFTILALVKAIDAIRSKRK